MRDFVEWIKKHQNLELFSEIAVFLMMYAGVELWNLYVPLDLNLKEIYLWFLMYGLINVAIKDAKWKKNFVIVAYVLAFLLYILFHSYGMGIELLIGMIGYTLIKVIEIHKISRIIYVLSLTTALTCGYLFDKDLLKNVIAIILVLAIREIAGLKNTEHSLRIFPVILLMEIVLICVPVSQKPIDWSFVMKAGEKVVEVCKDFALEIEYMMMDKAEYGIMQSSYDDTAAFGGRLFDSNKEELYLSAEATPSNLYLSGTEFEELDGKHWVDHTTEEPYGIWYAKYLNTMYQEGITKEEATEFSKICLTEITVGYLKTDTTFHYMYPLKIKKEIVNEMTDNLSEFRFQDVKKKKYAYPIVFMDFDYSNPRLNEILLQCEKYETGNWQDYDELDQYAFKVYNYHLYELISREEYENFVKQEGKMVDDSDFVINNVSERVKSLAEKITEGKSSDYEKAVAIEDFLRRNYTYSKKADNSETEDVIDTFLFETKTGYCMHFASAMTVLLQLNDIPARYVEGYMCDYSNKNEEGSYVITGNNSHAWPEAYMKGFGWVRFEPTATYSNAMERKWKSKVTVQKEIPNREVFPEHLEEARTEEGSEEAVKESNWSMHEISGSVAVFVVVFAGGLCSIFLVRRRIVYNHKNGLEKLEAELHDMKWLIMHLYPQEWENRPLLDYASVIEDKDLKSKIETICYLFYQSKYKKEEMESDRWKEVLAGKKELYQAYLQMEKRGKWKRKWVAFWRLETSLKTAGVTK